MILLALAALCVCLAFYPFTAYVVSLSLLPRRPIVRGAALRADEAITLCFCAYNEERVLPAKLENLRRLKARYPGLRILAYVDAATDRTAELLTAEPDLVETIVATDRHGKTHGMNHLVARATSELLVFTDANVMLDETALDRLSSYFADPAVGCICGHLIYVDEHSAAARTNSLQWRIEELTKSRESATGSVMGADGSIFAIRRCLHRPVPTDLIDDMYLSLDILCRGHRVVHADDVLAYEASASDVRDEYRRKIRIACQAVNVHRALWPRLRQLDAVNLYKYVAHRILRWLSPFLLGLALGLGAAGLMVLLGLAPTLGLLAGTLLVLALGLRLRWRPFELVWAVALSLVGVGVGVWQSIRGRRFQTWQPAGSVRGALGPTERGCKVLYLAHDVGDARVRLRAGELVGMGAEVLLVAFRRDKMADAAQPPYRVLELGTTKDYAYLDRASGTLHAAFRLWRQRAQLADADLILARNFEPAVLALLARRLAGGHSPLVYEVLDVHRFFVGDRYLNRVFRSMERILLRRIDLLAVSSSAYVNAYFAPLQGYHGPWLLLENKLPRQVAVNLEPVPVERGLAWPAGEAPVWTIGWFGMLRCMRSLELLTDLAGTLPDRVRILIRGYSTELSQEEFARRLGGLANVRFGGAYRNPDDLGQLYRNVDLVWAIDCYDAGGNSDWLLPNRLYEAGVFNVPLIARKGTAVGTRVADLGIGWTLEEPLEQSLRDLVSGLELEVYSDLRRKTAQLPRSQFVAFDNPDQLFALACQSRIGAEQLRL